MPEKEVLQPVSERIEDQAFASTKRNQGQRGGRGPCSTVERRQAPSYANPAAFFATCTVGGLAPSVRNACISSLTRSRKPIGRIGNSHP